MICSFDVLLPQASVAVHVRMMMSLAKQALSDVANASLYSTATSLLHASAASSTFPVNDKSVASSVHAIVASAGAENSGPVVSTTFTVCTTDNVLPLLSSAVQVRVMVQEPSQSPASTSSM